MPRKTNRPNRPAPHHRRLAAVRRNPKVGAHHRMLELESKVRGRGLDLTPQEAHELRLLYDALQVPPQRRMDTGTGRDKRMLEWELGRSRGANPGSSEYDWSSPEATRYLDTLTDRQLSRRIDTIRRQMETAYPRRGDSRVDAAIANLQDQENAVVQARLRKSNPPGDPEDHMAKSSAGITLAWLRSPGAGSISSSLSGYPGSNIAIHRHDDGDLTASVTDKDLVQRGPEVVVPPDQIQDVYHYALHHGTLEGWEPGSGGYAPIGQADLNEWEEYPDVSLENPSWGDPALHSLPIGGEVDERKSRHNPATRLVRGRDLTPDQVQQVKDAFIYRMTFENEVERPLAVSVMRQRGMAETSVSDDQWIGARAFHFTGDGQLYGPAELVENPTDSPEQYPGQHREELARRKRLERSGEEEPLDRCVACGRRGAGIGGYCPQCLRRPSKHQEDNPAASPEQYRLAQAVLSGTARSHMPVEVAREIVERTPARLRSEYSRYTTNPGPIARSGVSSQWSTQVSDWMHHRVLTGEDPLDVAFEAGKEWGEFGAAESGVSNARVRHVGFMKWFNNQAPGHLYREGPPRRKLTKSQLERAFNEGYKIGKVTARKSNPAADAAGADKMYETFHGVPPTETVVVEEEIVHHGDVAALGDLVEISIETPTGYKAVLDFTADPPLLCSSPDGKQLHLRGGNQDVDLAAIHMNGDEWIRDSMVLGEIANVVYRTRKAADGMKKLEYTHKAGEESGIRPVLIYDTLNALLSVSGGQYESRDVGIVN